MRRRSFLGNIMAPTDLPWNPRHLLWHMVLDLFMVIDGVLGLITLGMRAPTLVIWGQDSAFMDWLWSHEGYANAQEEKAKRALAIELGINPDDLVKMPDDEARRLVSQLMSHKMTQAIDEIVPGGGDKVKDLLGELDDMVREQVDADLTEEQKKRIN